MSGCECKSGFFTLRVCDNQVMGRCASCRRAMCREHAVPASLTQCLDCAAKEKRARQEPSPNRGSSRSSSGRGHVATHRDRDYGEDWLDESRDRVRTAATAGTVGGGAVAAHHHFNERDIRAFDDLEVERDDDERMSSGFGDS